jgi:hypothetical protein
MSLKKNEEEETLAGNDETLMVDYVRQIVGFRL